MTRLSNRPQPQIEDGRPLIAILERQLSQHGDRPLPLYLQRWLLEGIARHRLDGADLGKALGLRLVGRDSIATRDRRDRRDQALREAAGLLSDDPTALANAVRRFAVATWPRWRALPFAPSEAPPIHQVLFRAFQEAGPEGSVPASSTHLARILKKTPNPPY